MINAHCVSISACEGPLGNKSSDKIMHFLVNHNKEHFLSCILINMQKVGVTSLKVKVLCPLPGGVQAPLPFPLFSSQPNSTGGKSLSYITVHAIQYESICASVQQCSLY